MRCVSVGAPTAALAEAGKRLAAIQDRQIAAMRPGAVARDVDAILRQGVLQAGLRDSYDNITGYTLGYYAYPGPHTSDFTRIFHPEADWVIEPGMVFHMYASAARRLAERDGAGNPGRPGVAHLAAARGAGQYVMRSLIPGLRLVPNASCCRDRVSGQKERRRC